MSLLRVFVERTLVEGVLLRVRFEGTCGLDLVDNIVERNLVERALLRELPDKAT